MCVCVFLSILFSILISRYNNNKILISFSHHHSHHHVEEILQFFSCNLNIDSMNTFQHYLCLAAVLYYIQVALFNLNQFYQTYQTHTHTRRNKQKHTSQKNNFPFFVLFGDKQHFNHQNLQVVFHSFRFFFYIQTKLKIQKWWVIYSIKMNACVCVMIILIDFCSLISPLLFAVEITLFLIHSRLKLFFAIDDWKSKKNRNQFHSKSNQ